MKKLSLRTLLFSIAAVQLLLSCNGSSETTKPVDTTAIEVIDSVILDSNIIIDTDALMAKYSSGAALPFIPDSTWLADVELSDSNLLTANEAIYLSYGYVTSDISYHATTCVDDFVFFDSLKQHDEYDAYIETVGLGQMVISDAYVVQKLLVNDSTELLLWLVDYATYEACPYSAGRVLYASIWRNGHITSSTIIGEDSGGGDAPYWGGTSVLPNFTSTGFTVTRKEINGEGEVDENDNEIVTTEQYDFILEISPEGVWMITALKG
ncbi:MAG: hypothetical protein IPM74_18185 [Crocinitomicaceae bacterium]|nr:hypothetical protein [Crocinitomicaceae bacterium]MBK8927772.1 hypothetical protein [Crocinitomicaceae bacterium]